MAKAAVIWLSAAALLLVLPQVVTAPSVITILNQMAITIIFALSYNMLLGQAGMLSFGHAMFLGLGGFACIHVMNYAQAAGNALPLPLMPLIAGIFSMGVALLVGALSVRRSGDVFAMISLGIVELVAAAAIILSVFFQGGGAGFDRTSAMQVMGVDFGRQAEVYVLVIWWLMISVLVMWLFTRTPMGRMACAVRDNPERAAFIGYAPGAVKLITFAFAGFFAGVAGGLFAVTYEIITVENLGFEASGAILMVAFLGGVGVFAGPILGAVVFTIAQTVMSLETELWRLYLGVLFLACVMYFPSGLAGLITAHRDAWASGRSRLLASPYAAMAFSGGVCLLGLIGLAELINYSHGGLPGVDRLRLFWITWDDSDLIPWGIAVCMTIFGWILARRQAPTFRAAQQAAGVTFS
ncbi:MAG: branched-chain amino acid ABC transporter permease [Pseudomonadota bacterium]